MNRGEVWWANLPLPLGRRPVVLLSRSAAYDVRTSVTVAPITTRAHGIRSEVALGPEDGLPQVCVANLDSIATVEKAWLDHVIARLSPEKMAAVDKAIHFSLALRD